MKINQLSEDVRSDIRFFAFWVGNGTRIIGYTDTDYRPVLATNPNHLVTLFILYLKNFERVYGEDEAERDEEWLRSICESDFILNPPLTPEETYVDSLDPWKLAVIEFTELLCNSDKYLKDYSNTEILEALLYYGSQLEQVYAVLTNNFDLLENGQVKNKDHAFKRAFEAVKGHVIDGYKSIPDLEEWEVELV